MKKCFLFLLVIMFSGSPVPAQDEIDWETNGGVFYDFENDSSSQILDTHNNTSGWWSFSCNTTSDGQEFMIDENPDPTGINTSDSVGFFITTDQCTWEGTTTSYRFRPIDFANYPVILVKVLAPAPDLIFMVKVEDYFNNTNSPVEVQATTTSGIEWEELSFDFSLAANTGVDYGRVVIFPDFGGTYMDDWYFDDVVLADVEAPSNVEWQSNPKVSFVLAGNYPNPFNLQTVIEYTLYKQADVTLILYDSNGGQVAALISETQNAGTYHVPFDGSGLVSGIYCYRLKAGHEVATQKMILMK
jgi:hypothetical protein